MKNLLLTLHRVYRPGKGKYDQEDLFTEYLAWLLNRSPLFRTRFAERMLKERGDVDPAVFARANADTQVKTDEREWVDLVLDVDGAAGNEPKTPEECFRLAVEVKVDAPLTRGQLERYHRWLDDNAEKFRFVGLGALTPDRPEFKEELDPETDSHWVGRRTWSDARSILEDCVEEVRDRGLEERGPENDTLLERAAFVVVGDQFLELLEEEGLVAPTKIHPRGEIERLIEFERCLDRYKQRNEQLRRLIRHAIRSTKIPSLLEEKAGRGIVHKEDRKNLSKGRPMWEYHVSQNPDAFFFFGLLVSPPNTYVRRPDERWNAENYHTELIASYVMRGRKKGDKLSIDRDVLEEIASLLNEGPSGGPNSDLDVYVPENTDFSKWVSRGQTEGWDQLEANEQVQKMGEFYEGFVERFCRLHPSEDQPLLAYLDDMHQEQFARPEGGRDS